MLCDAALRQPCDSDVGAAALASEAQSPARLAPSAPRPLICVRGLGKRYQTPPAFGGRRRRGTFASALYTALASVVRRDADNQEQPCNAPDGSFWALRDVDLDVRPGDVLGLVGPNGSGKSTLLRILARVTTPTAGQVDIYGRLGALLEVGAGFHHEFTGRENVYLSGAILGMSRREVDGRFNEIVDFAGVGRFLDAPVKRYSSGMFLRLAFAVAAHLPVDVLLLDEALAVKDDEFRGRAVTRIRELAGQGRAVILVTHEQSLIRDVCTRAIRIERGRLADDGSPDDVLGRSRSIEAAA